MSKSAPSETKPTVAADGALFFEYSRAADPDVPAVPYAVLGADSYASGPTRVIAWDLSRQLGAKWPATSPGLMANFVRIVSGETLATAAKATSQLFYVVRGSGRTTIGDEQTIVWGEGDLFTVPSSAQLTHQAGDESVLYWVHDEPLLAYLGAKPDRPRFRPVLYTRERLFAELDRVRKEPGAAQRNRMGIILGNADTVQTMTVTHILWSLLNVLPAGVTQKPHRHNSVALDLCIAAKPGTYTLIAEKIDEGGNLIDPIRADWVPGAAFVTPPGLWHSHHNETGSDALVLPIQDAGLHTWMRTLDIQFSK